MIKANVVELKAKLSEFLDRAARGERIVICRHNRPVAELRALEELRTEPRPIGPLPERPTFEIAASFFEPMSADELNLWEGVAPADPLSPGWTPAGGRGVDRVAETKTKYSQRGRRQTRRRS
jgi:prevent-host-death family protein